MKLKPGTSGGYKLNFHRKIVELTLFLHQSLNGKFLISLVDIDPDTIVVFLQLSAENQGKLFVPTHIYIKECLNDHILSPRSLPFQIFLMMIQEEITWNQTGKIFDQLQNCSLKSMHHLNGIRLYNEISNIFIEYLTQYHLEEKIALQIGLYRLYNLNQFKSWSELVSYFRSLAKAIDKLTQSETFNIKEQTLTQIKRYIQQNLSRNLTLNEIANSVNYNSSYVSRYFKQMTGQSISQYIVQLRIDQAKKCLMSTNDSIQEIAVKLGVESPQYFSLVFKKYTGFSPRSYRQNTDSDS